MNDKNIVVLVNHDNLLVTYNTKTHKHVVEVRNIKNVGIKRVEE